LLRLQNARMGITDIHLMNVRLTATMALNGSPTDSLSARALGMADTVGTMDAGSGISMTAGMISVDVVGSAATLGVEATEERAFAGTAVSVAKGASGAVNHTAEVSEVVNRAVEVVSVAEPASEAAVEVVSVAVTAHAVEVLVAVHEVEATEAVAPTAEAARMVEDTGKLRLS
jgi:hypothetical protein